MARVSPMEAMAVMERFNDPTNGRSDTRERMLEAGLRLFAQHGFKGVTTRQLTAAAGVNVAAIAYHFGGKKQFYHAVMAQVVREMESQTAPIFKGLRMGIQAARGDPHTLARLTTEMVNNLLGIFMEDERLKWRVSLAQREFQQPSEAFEILFKRGIEPMHGAVSELVAAATGRRSDDQEIVIRAHAVIGQIVFFNFARPALLACLGWTKYTPERLAAIKPVVARSVLASLDLPISEIGEPGT